MQQKYATVFNTLANWKYSQKRVKCYEFTETPEVAVGVPKKV